MATTKYKAPAPRYVGPAAHTSRGSNQPINRIVLHSTVSPCEPGGSRAVARYFAEQSSGGSAHYIVDPSEVVQDVWDDTIAWHAPPNQHSLGVEMCDYPHPTSKARWNDKAHQQMWTRTVRLVAQLCLAYNVPPWFRPSWQLKRGMRGVTTHAEVSKAWHQTDHWDPGAWPRYRFMRAVRAEIKQIKKAAKKAA